LARTRRGGPDGHRDLELHFLGVKTRRHRSDRRVGSAVRHAPRERHVRLGCLVERGCHECHGNHGNFGGHGHPERHGCHECLEDRGRCVRRRRWPGVDSTDDAVRCRSDWLFRRWIFDTAEPLAVVLPRRREKPWGPRRFATFAWSPRSGDRPVVTVTA